MKKKTRCHRRQILDAIPPEVSMTSGRGCFAMSQTERQTHRHTDTQTQTHRRTWRLVDWIGLRADSVKSWFISNIWLSEMFVVCMLLKALTTRIFVSHIKVYIYSCIWNIYFFKCFFSSSVFYAQKLRTLYQVNHPFKESKLWHGGCRFEIPQVVSLAGQTDQNSHGL